MSERDAKTELLKRIGQLWGKTKQADYYKDKLLASTNYLAYNIDTLTVNEEVLKALDVCISKLEYAVEIYKKVVETVEKISP
jgi:hypothetical protein